MSVNFLLTALTGLAFREGGTRLADYSVIADVGETLVGLLRDELTPHVVSQPESIGLATPHDRGSLALCLYLYNVAESGIQRETQMVPRGQNSQQFPPLTVQLEYLLTAYSSADLTLRAIEEARIMGKAIQALYDFSVVRGNLLKGSLREANEQIRIVSRNLTIQELSDVWMFKDVPYRLSMAYSVGPVYVNSTRMRTTKKVTNVDVSIQG